MNKSTEIVLRKVAWILFFLLLLLNFINSGFSIKDDFIKRRLPFRIREGRAEAIEDSTLTNLRHTQIISIDTLLVANYLESRERYRGKLVLFHQDVIPENEYLDEALPDVLRNKKEVEIVYQDSLQTNKLRVSTIPVRNYSIFLNLAVNSLFMLFIFFNSFLLLRYSQHKENILVVFFLLLLAMPGNLAGLVVSNCWQAALTGLAAICFHHFILEKVRENYRIRKLYFATILLTAFCLLGISLIHELIYLLLYIWALTWMLISFFLLWKTYKKTGSIEFKRLLNAFKGIFIAISSLLAAFLLGTLVYIISQQTGQFGFYTIQGSILVILLLVSLLSFLIGILWFFGAFTWSLLTGTELGVKIRSTMIYTIVGVVFVVFFGLLDYTLGELLQMWFGRFMGSEFIAGIPATIGLLMFFNPVRQRVERIVDNKLNTSDLDFLEKTETFADSITGESVIEGFEEYICENLLQQLPIKKVALLSYDNEMKSYKFNEIRGSEVKENSPVQDVNLYLLENQIQRNYGALNENPQDVASYALIIPIIYDLEHKWFLALGAKNDGTTYSKRDEVALTDLAARIRLSLKFILEYDKIIDNKFNEAIESKDEQINKLKRKIKDLEERQAEFVNTSRETPRS